MKLRGILLPVYHETYFHCEDLGDILVSDLCGKNTIRVVRDWLVTILRGMPRPRFKGQHFVVHEEHCFLILYQNEEIYINVRNLMNFIDEKKAQMVAASNHLNFAAFGLVTPNEFDVAFQTVVRRLRTMESNLMLSMEGKSRRN